MALFVPRLGKDKIETVVKPAPNNNNEKFYDLPKPIGPPPYHLDLSRFKGTPYGQKGSYGTDFDENIRVVENYKNIKVVRTTPSSIPRPSLGTKVQNTSYDEDIQNFF